MPKIACPKCSAIHELNIDASCPECGTKYKLPERYIELAKKNVARIDSRERRKAKLLGFFGFLLHNTDSGAAKDSAVKAKKSKLRKRIAYACGLVLLCAIFVVVTLKIFSDSSSSKYL